jgi:hypothetical protein
VIAKVAARRLLILLGVALAVAVIVRYADAKLLAGEAGAAPHQSERAGANWAAPAEKAGRISPGLLIFDGRAAAYAPGTSDPIMLPPGTEIDLCLSPDGGLVTFDPFARVVHIEAPCAPRPLFADGF